MSVGRQIMGEKAWKHKDAERKRQARASNTATVREKERQKLQRWRAAKKALQTSQREVILCTIQSESCSEESTFSIANISPQGLEGGAGAAC